MQNKKGFTLLELLVVVLIIGILAAIALPQYQLAVDKAKFTKMINITKAIQESQQRSDLLGNNRPTFNETDFDIPANCTILPGNKKFSCANNTWGCHIFENSRCSDLTINATYIYYLRNGLANWYCCAHTDGENDRANRMCKSLTGKKNSLDKDFNIFNGDLIPMKCYKF